MMLSTISITTAQEDAVLLRFKHDEIEHSNADVRAFCDWANQAANRPKWLLEIVPSFETVLLIYTMNAVDEHEVVTWVKSATLTHSNSRKQALLTIPVCYELALENDLSRMAAHTGLTEAEIIACHWQQTYQVYALGFAPGFAYLGHCQDMIATPRLATPRKRVPRGAVAVADRQTAVYPSASPGGWNIVGYCPLHLIAPHHQPISPFVVGQQVSFTPISAEQYNQLNEQYWYDAAY